MLSMPYVRLLIKVKVRTPENFKVGWYPHKITFQGRVTLIASHLAEDPMKEGRARSEVKQRSFLLCLVVFSTVSSL